MNKQQQQTRTAIIIGAGLVGSLWAVYLSKAGYAVTIYERRKDLRKTKMSAGRSINLAMSYRGWKGLDDVGVGDDIRKIAIPMYGRTMHYLDNSTSFQPYGNNNQAIYSVARGAINQQLMDIAESHTHTQIHFDEECIDVDLEGGKAVFRNTQTDAITTAEAEVVFGTDGAFSAVRYQALQKLDRFNYSQTYIEDGYREILLPANPDGSYKMAKETLHIWPRGRFMLIALPNFDGSFTCTLFMPFDNHKYCFNNLKTKQQVDDFFEDLFPDFYRMMPNVADEWENHPLSSLAIIRCFPWTHSKVALVGDAAHATVPFFGQGMNCGFEDCSVLWELMQKHDHNWAAIFKEYEVLRKPNGDAVQDLSLKNYLVMRDKVADPDFLLTQKIERRINYLYPESYFPLYTMVSFTNIAYTTALEKGEAQEAMMRQLIRKNHLTPDTDEATIDRIIHEFMKTNSSSK
ncbi:MAG: FAD-dependent monooxygenase [Chitinophagales bacterium]|nr:FAD-dependent monooxygenase [Chitinophagales bacterium]